MRVIRSYNERKELIRSELLALAKARPVVPISYGALGARLGMHAMVVSNKKMLDEIADEEKKKGLPNITFLLQNQRTKYPGQIGLVLAHPPSAAQRERTREEFQQIIDLYSPWSPNPYG